LAQADQQWVETQMVITEETLHLELMVSHFIQLHMVEAEADTHTELETMETVVLWDQVHQILTVAVQVEAEELAEIGNTAQQVEAEDHQVLAGLEEILHQVTELDHQDIKVDSVTDLEHQEEDLDQTIAGLLGLELVALADWVLMELQAEAAEAAELVVEDLAVAELVDHKLQTTLAHLDVTEQDQAAEEIITLAATVQREETA
jgi:hypothetical protein